MSGTSVTFNGTTFEIPFSGDLEYGEVIRGALIELLTASVSTGVPTFSTLTFLPQSANLADMADFDPNASPGPNSYWRLQGSGGAVTLNSIVAAETVAPVITSSKTHFLMLEGRSDTNTVTILDGAGLNTRMNGDIILSNGTMIGYIWNPSDLLWDELFRNI